MGETLAPPLAKNYAANVALVVVALFPGLINTTALAVLDPVLARDLGVPAAAAGWIPIASDATIAFGCVIAAEVTRFIDARRAYLTLLAVSLFAAVVSAAAPNLPVLVAGHAIAGLATGMLFILALPALVTGFPQERLPGTMTVVVGALFGASTAGPPLAALVASSETWRLLFAANAVVALGALVLGARTIAPRDPLAPNDPRDWLALALAVTGATLLFAGAGLSLASPGTAVGLELVGLVLLAGLIEWERRRPDALLPVAKMITAYPIIGAVGTIAGSMLYTAVFSGALLVLERVHGLGPGDAGRALWPDVIAAVAAALIVGRVIRTPYIPIVTIGGLVALTAAAFAFAGLARGPAGGVVAATVVAAFGAGLTVTPGLFVTGLSVQKALVGRAIALLQLFRLALGSFAAPALASALAARIAATAPVLRTGAKPDVASGEHAGGAAAFAGALAAAMHDVFLAVASFGALAAAGVTAILIFSPARLQRPDFRAFLEAGEPALSSPPIDGRER